MLSQDDVISLQQKEVLELIPTPDKVFIDTQEYKKEIQTEQAMCAQVQHKIFKKRE